MKGVEYKGIESVEGPIVVVRHSENVSFGEMVSIRDRLGAKRIGRIIDLSSEYAVVQVFGSTTGIDLQESQIEFLETPMELPVGKELMGRVFNGLGKPIDGYPDIISSRKMNVNGSPINPYARVYPEDFIQTGVSSIDGMNTLIRGQKLPIFSGNGLPHNRLAAQIVRQARLLNTDDEFVIVFAGMGIKHDIAHFFVKSFEESGVLSRVVMFQSLADSPSIERIITPRCALTAAEYLAYELNMHVLVVMTDMTNYCEALREISATRGEVPGRKGYPGYLYSDLAELYERAGRIKGSTGSITQLPILTMPNDDVSNPIPDLTGYITEGQISMDRELSQKGLYPPVGILPSLSRLMRDGVGEGLTRDDHKDVSNQLFASYAKVKNIRGLASILGEDSLSENDRKYLEFGLAFENEFLCQDEFDNRSVAETLDIGWRVLSLLPRGELYRISPKLIDKYMGAEKSLEGGR